MKKFLFILLILCGCTSVENTEKMLEISTDGIENIQNHKLVFIQHGLASNKNHHIVQIAKEEFLKKGYIVVTFNSLHSLGKNSRDVENTTLYTFKKDLENVIAWAKNQKFYTEPFTLVGHSLGGASVFSYANDNFKKVDLVIGIAPVISGELWEKSCLKNMHDFCVQWKNNNFYEYTDPQNGNIVEISYDTIESTKFFDINKFANSFKPDVLLIAGEEDKVVPSNDLKELFEKFKTNKKIVTIQNGSHNLVTSENELQLKQAIRENIQ